MPGCGNTLDVLFAVEKQAEKSAKKVLDALPWDRINNIALELLGAKIC